MELDNQELRKGQKVHQGVDISNKLFRRKVDLDIGDNRFGGVKKISPEKMKIEPVLRYQEDMTVVAADAKPVFNTESVNLVREKVKCQDIVCKPIERRNIETITTTKADLNDRNFIMIIQE